MDDELERSSETWAREMIDASWSERMTGGHHLTRWLERCTDSVRQSTHDVVNNKLHADHLIAEIADTRKLLDRIEAHAKALQRLRDERRTRGNGIARKE